MTALASGLVNLEAENAVLGMALMDPDTLAEIVTALRPEHFADPANRRLFSALAEARQSMESGECLDLGSLVIFLRAAGDLEAVGGAEGLRERAESFGAIAALPAYVRPLRDAALRRRALSAADRLRTAAEDAGASPDRMAAILAEAEADLARMGNGQGDTKGVLVNLGDVKARPVRWLWPGRIPSGKVTLVAGDPNIGKSMISLDMAARVSRGTAWPDGAANAGAGGVVILTAEDDLGDTVVPRLQAAGADVGRVRALAAVKSGGQTRTFDLGRDVEVLAEAIRATPDCRLAIIDPVTAYLPGKDGNSNVEIRSVLAPLAALAAESGVAVVGVTHLRKGDGAPLYRIMGSLGFVAAARAVWAACKDQADPTGRRRFLLPCKNNLAPDGGGLAYRIEVLNGDTVPVVTWESGPVAIRLEDVLPTQGAPGPDPEAQREAEDFLRQALAGGPRAAKEVIREAGDLGITRRTLYRARQGVGVRADSERYGQWRLG